VTWVRRTGRPRCSARRPGQGSGPRVTLLLSLRLMQRSTACPPAAGNPRAPASTRHAAMQLLPLPYCQRTENLVVRRRRATRRTTTSREVRRGFPVKVRRFWSLSESAAKSLLPTS